MANVRSWKKDNK